MIERGSVKEARRPPSKRFKLRQHVPLRSDPLRVIVRGTEIESQFRFHPIPASSPTATAQALLLTRRCLLLFPLCTVCAFVPSALEPVPLTRLPLRRRPSLARSAPGKGGGQREILHEAVVFV